MSPRLRSALVVTFGIAVGGVALATALAGADVDAIVAAMTRAGWVTIAIAALLHVAIQAIYAWRWRAILRWPSGLPFGSAFGIVGLGYLANQTLPGRPGELIRAAVVRARCHVELARGIGSLALEKLLDGGAILLATLASFAGGVASDGVRALAIGGAAVATVGVLGFGVAASRRRALAARGATGGLIGLIARSIALAVEPAATLRIRRALVATLAGGVAITAAIVGQLALIGYGVGVGPAPIAWLALYGALGLTSLLPGAPGYIGTYQLAAVAILGHYGVERENAIAIAAIYQLSRLVGAFAVTLWFVLREGFRTVLGGIGARFDS
ncbi:MAG: flippase-like domain-containing protein [Chloroflexota bacterium]|nr:MAG: flippase-like domain-containing protein [Chloroflexota bacterium]